MNAEFDSQVTIHYFWNFIRFLFCRFLRHFNYAYCL